MLRPRPHSRSSRSRRLPSASSRARVSRCQPVSSRARVATKRDGPLSVHGPSASRSPSRTGRAARTKPTRSPARPKNLPSERRITRPGAPACAARLSSGVVSAKASSITSQPPRAASRSCHASSCAGGHLWPVGLLGWTSSNPSTCAMASSMPAGPNAGLGSPPGTGVFRVTWREDADARPLRGREEHSRECLDRGLRTRKRKQFGAAVVGRGCGLEAVVFLGQAQPVFGRYGGRRIAARVDAGGQVQPVGKRNAKTRCRLAAASAVLKHGSARSPVRRARRRPATASSRERPAGSRGGWSLRPAACRHQWRPRLEPAVIHRAAAELHVKRARPAAITAPALGLSHAGACARQQASERLVAPSRA